MGIRFNADEIFEIAEKIETNGANFYRRASERFSDAGTKKVLTNLAEMENHHKIIFAAMRNDLKTQEKKPVAYDPQNQTKEYLEAMADGRVFDINADPEKYLSAAKSPRDILKTALGFEKDSIAFYTGIKDMIPENLGRDKIDGIIHEEMYHITVLNAELKKIS
jgi:rubrerythrin